MTIRANKTGTCPHCKVRVRFEATRLTSDNRDIGTIDPLKFTTSTGFGLEVCSSGCPGCGKPIVTAISLTSPLGEIEQLGSLLWPDTGNRPVPREVEEQAPALAADFREAVSVFPKSKKASAALSRRCLQFVLREQAGTRSRDLSGQIDEILDRLPSELASNVDAIRHVGNFAAHPLKSTNSGEIIDVEETEAEWLLDVLEELFDYYYVAPTKAAARREALNKKLQELGKPPLKAPSKEQDSTTEND